MAEFNSLKTLKLKALEVFNAPEKQKQHATFMESTTYSDVFRMKLLTDWN